VQLVQRLLSTRGGTIAVSGLAAVLAAVVLLVYLQRYRESVQTSSQPVRVLVANGLIEKGTPGNVVGSQGLYAATSTPRTEVNEGAISDPGLLRGRVAVDDIYPGKQLTLADFSPVGADALGTRISEDQRAMAVAIDSAHGMIGNVQAGDHVDVFAGFNVKRLQPDGTPDPDASERAVLKLILEDVLVLGVPTETRTGFGASASQTSNVTLRVSDEQAAQLAFSADNGKVWIVLRPRTGATPTRPDIVTVETLLFGVKPITAVRSFGGRR
jgi:Flp pilus assembly protein CpaB